MPNTEPCWLDRAAPQVDPAWAYLRARAAAGPPRAVLGQRT
eukprot:CAMPEP_0181247936 /NCGR_PEP_ID=MMETSP1096-20121128/44892_1 /TAXON_ID=156174 ORGANISM="Chrysochromulina ericina, Strain CCMP281" /NCGR_SAMPLE_ID=MMETSP1096 /ASSEMBLY_ACC=CAM_ASM_000453 /LENGTH=40 /DNA_ID= /DNA_START= /DNA_END= /DNA_ORIENTATION=